MNIMLKNFITYEGNGKLLYQLVPHQQSMRAHVFHTMFFFLLSKSSLF